MHRCRIWDHDIVPKQRPPSVPKLHQANSSPSTHIPDLLWTRIMQRSTTTTHPSLVRTKARESQISQNELTLMIYQTIGGFEIFMSDTDGV